MVRDSSWLAASIPSLTDVAFLMAALFVFGRRNGACPSLNGDMCWHIRASDWIFTHGRVPRQDFFSFTRPGRSWCAWEWLPELLMARLHGWGMAGVVLVATLVLSGNVLVEIALTVVTVGGSSIPWRARPYLATLLFMKIFLAIQQSRDVRLLWLLLPLTVQWTNLQAGVLLVAIYAIREQARARVWSALAFPDASLVTTYGWHLHVHSARYLGADSRQFEQINEFGSFNVHASLALCFELMLALAAAAGLWILMRLHLDYVLLALLPAHMALVSARNMPLFLIADARARLPRLAHRVLEAFRWFAREMRSAERLTRVPAAGIVCCGILAAVLFAPPASGEFRSELDTRDFPARAIPALSTPGARIFTSDQCGDSLIYCLYPDINFFVDGRSEFYGGDFEQICQDVSNVHYHWEQKLERDRVDCVLLPAEAPLAGALRKSGRWRVRCDDGRAIVFRAAGGETVSGGKPSAGRSAITLRSEPK